MQIPMVEVVSCDSRTPDIRMYYVCISVGKHGTNIQFDLFPSAKQIKKSKITSLSILFTI